MAFQSIDCLITYHGTSAIEFAYLGKPVLIPDKGRYEKSGFVLHSKTKQEYIENLKSNWWEKLNLKKTKKYSEYFSGWFFCHPKRQKGFLIEDDMKQDEIYYSMQDLIEKNLADKRKINSLEVKISNLKIAITENIDHSSHHI